MKIPYVKIYTADLLAKSRRLTAEQIGNALIGICEQAFDNETQYEPKNDAERAFFNTLIEWKNESVSALKQKKLAGKKGGKITQARKQLSDGSTACLSALSTRNKQTETETETEIEYKQPTSVPSGTGCLLELKSEQKSEQKKERKKSQLQLFSNEVLKNFEPDVKKDYEIAVWFKRNCRCLTDILNYCGGDIRLAIRTIDVCIRWLEERKLTGGYEAVLKRIPDYCATAKKELEVENAKTNG